MYKILANTVFLGKDIHFLTECHSTNDMAMEKIKNGELTEGSIVITEVQTRGKGQRGNIWWSVPYKNLTFSLVLKPYFLKPSEQFELSIAIALAVVETLSDYFSGVRVKWPNDVLHEVYGKLGGILIENIINQKGIEYSIIGIGLNINQKMSDLPFSTSFMDLTGKEWDKAEIFEILVQKIEKNYLLLKKGQKNVLRALYLSQLYRFGKEADYFDERPFKGKIVGIGSDGRLIIEKTDGSLNHYAFKEVRYL
ncbi:biotin--[acetyl-CoA-carboxylase] ligase [Cecembia sp.]|uniref:biotin--[acetyl-CoA-carboxylase] ligase n=1 Tax=Cecembia sp. TaxID=1898110 RepID=UPI0025B940A9|nr:biotin--[acetyl-CoA-carboxylase] ligase [Cecembia sp.]